MSHWTTSGRSRLKAKQKSSFAQEAQMRANVVAPEAIVVPQLPTTATTYYHPSQSIPSHPISSSNQYPQTVGTYRKYRYTYGNPIHRRGLSVPIGGRQHYYQPPPHPDLPPPEGMMIPPLPPLPAPGHHDPHAYIPASMGPPIQTFRRIRDPHVHRYQPHPSQAPPRYPPDLRSPDDWHGHHRPIMYPQEQEENDMTQFSQHSMNNPRVYPPEEAVRQFRHRHFEPAWGESSVAPSIHSSEGPSTATPLRHRPPPPPPFQMNQPRGFARFQRKTEMDDLETAEATWNQNVFDELSVAVDIDSFDPAQQPQRNIPPSSQISVQPQQGFTQQNQHPILSNEQYHRGLPTGQPLPVSGYISNDRRQPRSVQSIPIPTRPDGTEDLEPRIPPAPRHESHFAHRANESFSFDPVSSARTSSDDWEHLRDSQGGLSRFRRGVPMPQSPNKWGVPPTDHFKSESRYDSTPPHHQRSKRTTHLNQSKDKAPVDTIELPPLRFFNDNVEVDITGRPLSRSRSRSSKRRKSAETPRSENQTRLDEDLLFQGVF